MHERRRQEGVVSTLTAQTGYGTRTQVPVKELEEVVTRLNVPPPPGPQQARPRSGDGCHFPRSTATIGCGQGQVKACGVGPQPSRDALASQSARQDVEVER
jgi:hypothetical protein